MDNNTQVRIAARDVPMVRIDELELYERNAKRHGAAQIEKLRASLREFGFVAPVLIDEANRVIAGHGRIEAARAEGMTEVPCVRVSELSEAQRRAYIIADNRLSELGEWDMEALRFEMQALRGMDFDETLTGFTLDEIAEGAAAPSADEAATEGAEEVDPAEFSDDAFSCQCPRCGFRFSP